MCGIWAYINLKRKQLDTVQLFQDFCNLKHRGPDNSFFESYHNLLIGFHRLSIIDDTFMSNQPFIYEDDIRTIIFMCNGEIYNYKELAEWYNLDITNDCQIIPKIYHSLCKTNAENAINRIIKDEVKGEFSFLLFEFDRMKNLKKVIAGRDEIGIRPLYFSPYVFGNDCLFFTSEIKGGLSFKGDLMEFPPGHIITYNMDEIGNIDIDTDDFTTVYDTISHSIDALPNIQSAVMNSVRRRLNADKPFAFLLSGGIDSSLVAAISAKILGKPIRTFCCGMREGTDLKYARMVAKHIGSTHTEVMFTEEEGLEAIGDVIRTVESWDTTTIRASVGQYLVSKYIGLKTDCKVVMVGEGPDEVCSSYLFNWYAPNGEELDIAARDYVHNIHYYDVKRADRCISRWGLEGRVPLLDPEFIKAYWNIIPERRLPSYMNMEKWWLREAFSNTGLLPDEVIWRKKEAFSDGVSGERSWYKIIQDWVETKVTDEELVEAFTEYPYCTPVTKEAYYYRKVFSRIFHNRQNIIPGFWQPKWSADGEVTKYMDPSARVLNVY